MSLTDGWFFMLVIFCTGIFVGCLLISLPEFYRLLTRKFKSKNSGADYWSKPFKCEVPHTSYSSRTETWEMRFHTKTYQFQRFYDNKWRDKESVVGSPMNIEIYDFLNNAKIIKLNPYEYFNQPESPTISELAAFQLEYNFDYKTALPSITKIITSQAS